MPFKKRRQEKQLHAKENHLREEQYFEAAIQRATQIEDPAEKVLALRKIDSHIKDRIKTENKEMEKVTDKKKGKSLLAAVAPAAAGGAAIGLFAGPASFVAAPVAAVVWAGTAAVGIKRAESAEKKTKKAAENHRNYLTEQANRAYRMADAVIENNAEEISQSSLFIEVKALSGNAGKFAKALANHIATQETPAAEEPPQAKAAPGKLRIIKKDSKQL